MILSPAITPVEAKEFASLANESLHRKKRRENDAHKKNHNFITTIRQVVTRACCAQHLFYIR